MAIPTIVASGAHVANASTSNIQVPYPSGINSGDTLLLIYSISATTASLTPSGWSGVGNSQATNPRTVVYSKIADGTETGNLTFNTVNSTDAKIARMHRFAGAHSFEGAAFNTGTDKNPAHPDVTTTDSDRLVCAVGGVNDNETASSFTGETGGDLTLHSQDSTSLDTDHLLYLQTAGMASSGTVSGGTWTYSGATEDWSHVIFAIFEDANKELATAAGTYSVVGVDADLEFGYVAETDAGTYSVTGVDADLEFGYALDTDAGVYSVTGVDANLEFGYALDVDAGVYSLVGVDAELNKGITLLTDAGTYSISGVDANLEYGRVLETDAGTYLLSGVDASLEFGAALDTVAGSYSLVGVDATLQLDIPLALVAGSYSVVGVDASLEFGAALDVVAGTYSLSGVDADLNKGITLATVAGSYSVVGVDASLEFGYALDTDAGSYSLVGVDAALQLDIPLAVAAGSYSLVGVDATLQLDIPLSVVAGVYSLIGVDADLIASGENIVFPVDAGTYALSGVDADLEFGYALDVDAGSYSVTGVDAALEFGFALLTAAGAYSLVGVDASLEHGFALDVAAGTYSLSGVDANLNKGITLELAAGSYSVTGVDASLEFGFLLDTAAGSYSLIGIDAILTDSTTEDVTPFPFEGTHGWGYIDERIADLQRKVFDKAQKDWDEDLNRIVEKAFKKILGEPVEEPKKVKAKERRKIVRLVNFAAKADGLGYRIKEIERLVRLYEELVFLQMAEALALDFERRKMLEDEDAALAVLMMM